MLEGRLTMWLRYQPVPLGMLVQFLTADALRELIMFCLSWLVYGMGEGFLMHWCVGG